MLDFGIHWNRKVYYQAYSTDSDWAKELPNSNWCAIILTEEYFELCFKEVISKIADNNVGYVVSIGPYGNLIENWTDLEFVDRDIDPDRTAMPHHVMTISDEDFEEGLWSGLNITFSPDTEILELIIIDLTSNPKSLSDIKDLLQKFKEGYLPPD